MKLKVYTLNAFGKSATGGNPAGVVLDADNLSEIQMKAIAKEVGLSETAFLMKSDVADFKLKFFTPTKEVPLCGHATIANFFLLFKLEIIAPGTYTQETNAGILNIDIKEDGTTFMSQTQPIFSGLLDKNKIADSLNIPADDIFSDMPIEIVSTGLPDIIVPVNSLNSLLSIDPNFDLISKISKKHNAVGYHVFTFETKSNAIANSRNFAPLYGIPEESATGTATGALASYLFKHNKLPVNNLNSLDFEQGYSMSMPSEIKADLEVENGRISNVKVGGKCSNLKEMYIKI